MSSSYARCSITSALPSSLRNEVKFYFIPQIASASFDAFGGLLLCVQSSLDPRRGRRAGFQIPLTVFVAGLTSMDCQSVSWSSWIVCFRLRLTFPIPKACILEPWHVVDCARDRERSCLDVSTRPRRIIPESRDCGYSITPAGVSRPHVASAVCQPRVIGEATRRFAALTTRWFI